MKEQRRPAADAVGLLALIAAQDVELADPDDPGDPPRWRIAQQVAPDRVISVVDPEARHAHKTVHRRQDGFQSPCRGRARHRAGHRLPTVQGLRRRQQRGDRRHRSAHRRDRTRRGAGRLRLRQRRCPSDAGRGRPRRVDQADPAARSSARRVHRRRLHRRPRCRNSHLPGGTHPANTATATVTFGAARRDCPLRARCTTSRTGRTLQLHQHEDLLRAARRYAETDAFQQPYRQHRPMVERSTAWLVRGGNRNVRYRGIANNDLWLHHRLAGLSLRRLLNLGLHQQRGAWTLA